MVPDIKILRMSLTVPLHFFLDQDIQTNFEIPPAVFIIHILAMQNTSGMEKLKIMCGNHQDPLCHASGRIINNR